MVPGWMMSASGAFAEWTPTATAECRIYGFFDQFDRDMHRRATWESGDGETNPWFVEDRVGGSRPVDHQTASSAILARAQRCGPAASRAQNDWLCTPLRITASTRRSSLIRTASRAIRTLQSNNDPGLPRNLVKSMPSQKLTSKRAATSSSATAAWRSSAGVDTGGRCNAERAEHGIPAQLLFVRRGDEEVASLAEEPAELREQRRAQGEDARPSRRRLSSRRSHPRMGFGFHAPRSPLEAPGGSRVARLRGPPRLARNRRPSIGTLAARGFDQETGSTSKIKRFAPG